MFDYLGMLLLAALAIFLFLVGVGAAMVLIAWTIIRIAELAADAVVWLVDRFPRQ